MAKKHDEGLIPVKCILNDEFYIPDYQRGYRWEGKQARQLLDDIYEFNKKERKSAAIYCIQPLVVTKRDDIKDKWVVVDGQQRLTTLFIILKCLPDLADYESLYSIEYQTRSGSAGFLDRIKSKSERSRRNENIDFFYLTNVYEEVKDWIDNKFSSHYQKKKFKELILERVCFIWYEFKNTDKSKGYLEAEVGYFSRLNKGQINLTDAELIKALFLNESKYPDDEKNLLDDVARKWDQIENTLQNDEFWAFIYGGKQEPVTRIDYILDIVYKLNETTPDNSNNGENDRSTFEFFNKKLSQKKKAFDNIKSLWYEDIYAIYETFLEWYQDYRLFHYIGYLVTIMSGQKKVSQEDFVVEVLKEWRGEKETKESFTAFLKGKIVDEIKKESWIKDTVAWAKEEERLKNRPASKRIDALSEYCFELENPEIGPKPKKKANQAKAKCVKILLLHNVETIIQENDQLIKESKYNLPNFTKFPFHLYQREKWEVEHIRPNAGDDRDEKYLVLYALKAKEYYATGSENYEAMDDYLNNLSNDIPSSDLELDENRKNTICNFTLLDQTSNQEYQNSPFPVKREFVSNKERGKKIIYSLPDSGTKADGDFKGSYRGKDLYRLEEPAVAFVPPCTKNIFTKNYTDMPASMLHWNNQDANQYWAEMKRVLASYFEELAK